ncbi:unnamed protein product [Schistosoma mattheei]|uniref:Uncharacterized protein n=1 Tax=Schistosoma mattheei TaxID=31246 RepID=A0A183PNH5_9TREM|nr:unnamed protein product [Schistosoma mattheei]
MRTMWRFLLVWKHFQKTSRNSTQRSYSLCFCPGMKISSQQYDSPVPRKTNKLRPPLGRLIFKCASCNKSFASRSDVAIHYKHVHAAKLIKCAECDRTFTSKLTLQSHVRVAHPDDDEEEEIAEEVDEEDEEENDEEDKIEIPLSPTKPPIKTVNILLFRTNKKLRIQNPTIS